MGINKFFSIFDTHDTHTISDFKGLTFAVDASFEIHRAYLGMKSVNTLTDKNGKTTQHIQVVLTSILSKLKQNIKMIWIFDGKCNPLKLGTRKSRNNSKKNAEEKLLVEEDENKQKSLEKRCFRLNKEIIDDVKRILNGFNIPWVVAPDYMDAEKIAAYFTNLQGTKFACDYVLTNDSDALAFGAQGLITQKKGKYLTYELDEILAGTKITDFSLQDLVKVSVIMGNDYCVKTPRIGKATILKKYKEQKLTKEQEAAAAYYMEEPGDPSGYKWNNEEYLQKNFVPNNPKLTELYHWLVNKKDFNRSTTMNKLKKIGFSIEQ